MNHYRALLKIALVVIVITMLFTGYTVVIDKLADIDLQTVITIKEPIEDTLVPTNIVVMTNSFAEITMSRHVIISSNNIVAQLLGTMTTVEYVDIGDRPSYRGV